MSVTTVTSDAAPYIAAVNAMKRARRAAILAHNCKAPEIFHGVADITGDSLALAQAATEVDADIIVLCGVHFMAETVKLLNPEKVVLIPDARAGCSLAESITPADVRLLRERHPGVPVVTYVNTSAAVKAESDICCTSANAVEVVESLGADRVLFLPDEYLGKYVAGSHRASRDRGGPRDHRWSRFTIVGLQAAALKPRINPGGRLGPQTDFYGEQRIDLEAAQVPTLFIQLRERSPRRPGELVPQLLIGQEAADNSFDRSL